MASNSLSTYCHACWKYTRSPLKYTSLPAVDTPMVVPTVSRFLCNVAISPALIKVKVLVSTIHIAVHCDTILLIYIYIWLYTCDVKLYSETSLRRTTQGLPLLVCCRKVSVFQGVLVYLCIFSVGVALHTWASELCCQSSLSLYCVYLVRKANKRLVNDAK